MENLVLFPGQSFVTRDPFLISSSLGSCVEVVLHDPVLRITGVSLFVSPEPGTGDGIGSARYGSLSLPAVLHKMCSLGAVPERILARVFGGSRVPDQQTRSSFLGKKNVDYALTWLRSLRIPVVSTEFGGLQARRVTVNTIDFSVKHNILCESSNLDASYGNYQNLRGPVRVVVVDNSASARTTVTRMLEQSEQFVVLGSAADAYEARELLVHEEADVVMIADNLPKVSALSLLQSLMKHFPIPVVMMSTSGECSQNIFDSLECGAVDFVHHIHSLSDEQLPDYSAALKAKVLAAALVKSRVCQGRPEGETLASVLRSRPGPLFQGVDVLLCGGDTGAHKELEAMLCSLPEQAPAVLIALDSLSPAHIERLRTKCRLPLVEARDLQPLESGRAYFPPQGHCFKLESLENCNRIRLVERPSGFNLSNPVDVLFESALNVLATGSKCAALLLSGLSLKSLDSLIRLRDRGAATFAVEPSSSRMPLLPASAVALGAIDFTVDFVDLKSETLKVA
jgi:two-component system chemotaxis response regulator CheB